MVRVIDFLRLNLFASVLLLAGAGCVVIDESDRHTLDKFRISGGEGNVEEQIVVSNYGYYLFNFIPVFCGNGMSGYLFRTMMALVPSEVMRIS